MLSGASNKNISLFLSFPNFFSPPRLSYYRHQAERRWLPWTIKKKRVLQLMGTLDRGGVESLVLRYAKIKKIIVHSHNTKDWRKTSILQSLCGPVLCKLSIPAACSSEAGEWMFKTRNIHLIPLPVDTKRFTFNQKKRDLERNRMHLHYIVLFHAGNFREAKIINFSLMWWGF